MANIKSNEKSHRKDMKKKIYNKQYRSSVKTSIKKAYDSAAKNDVEELRKNINNANKLLDRGQYKKIYHRNKVAREKRKLALLANKTFEISKEGAK